MEDKGWRMADEGWRKPVNRWGIIWRINEACLKDAEQKQRMRISGDWWRNQNIQNGIEDRR